MKKIHTITPDFPILKIPSQAQKGEESYFNYKVDKQDELSILQGKHIFIDENGYVFNRYEIFPCSFFLRTKLAWLPSFKHIQKSLLEKRKIKIDEGIWIYDIWTPGYFHWFADALHRYFQIVNKLQRKLPLILPAELKNQKYITDSLERLEIKTFWIESGTLVSVGVLYTIDYLHCPGTFTLGAMKTLRSKILDQQATKNNDRHRKVYISRAKAKIRKIENEEALIPMLKDVGFEVFYLENLQWEGQVELLASANVLLSLHGAGLTNMMWMPLGSQVIELRMKGSFEQWAYYEMAASFDHQYHYLLCEPQREGLDPHDGNVTVNVSELNHLLENLTKNAFNS